MSTFSIHFKQTRWQCRMKQEQSVRLTGITTRSIQNYEAGSCQSYQGSYEHS